MITSVSHAWHETNIVLPGFLFMVSLGLAISFVLKAFYNRYFHPLSRYPGPFWGSITDFFKFYAINSIPTKGLKLHEKHGECSKSTTLRNMG